MRPSVARSLSRSSSANGGNSWTSYNSRTNRRSRQRLAAKAARFALAVGSTPRALLDPYALAADLACATSSCGVGGEERDLSALSQSCEETAVGGVSLRDSWRRLPASDASFGEASLGAGGTPASYDSEQIFGEDSYQRAREAEALRNLVRSTTPVRRNPEPAPPPNEAAVRAAVADGDAAETGARPAGDDDDGEAWGFFLDMDGDEPPVKSFLPDHLAQAATTKPIDIPVV